MSEGREKLEYGFPTEPKIKILGSLDDYWYISASEVVDFLNELAGSMNDPWPFQRNWRAVREAESLGCKFGPIAKMWSEYGEEESKSNE